MTRPMPPEPAPRPPRTAPDGPRYRPRQALLPGHPAGAEALPPPRRAASGALRFREADGPALLALCADAAAWPAGADGAPTLAVAVSAGRLAAGGFLGQLGAALEASGLAPGRLLLQVDAAALDADEDALLALAAARDAGVGVALDRFGADAGLGALRRLPLTGLKLHRSLLGALPGDREDAAVLRAVAGVARALRLPLVADGVETEAQRAFLRAVGCAQAQGPLIGPAVPAAAMAALLGP